MEWEFYDAGDHRHTHPAPGVALVGGVASELLERAFVVSVWIFSRERWEVSCDVSSCACAVHIVVVILSPRQHLSTFLCSHHFFGLVCDNLSSFRYLYDEVCFVPFDLRERDVHRAANEPKPAAGPGRFGSFSDSHPQVCLGLVQTRTHTLVCRIEYTCSATYCADPVCKHVALFLCVATHWWS